MEASSVSCDARSLAHEFQLPAIRNTIPAARSNMIVGTSHCFRRCAQLGCFLIESVASGIYELSLNVSGCALFPVRAAKRCRGSANAVLHRRNQVLDGVR